MRKVALRGLAAAVLCVALGASASSASAATFKIATSSGAAAYTGPVTFVNKPGTTVQFITNNGTITCSGNPALYGRGNISVGTGNATYGVKGTLNSIAFGNPIAGPFTNQPASSACPSTIPNLNPCTGTVTNLPQNVSARSNSSNTGVQIQLGPLNVRLDCVGSGGGTISCFYTSGTSGSPSPITGAAANGSNDLVFANSATNPTPFARVSPSPAVCPVSATFSATLNLIPGTYTTPNTPTSPVPTKLAAYSTK